MSNVETVQRLYDAFARRDADTIRRLLHPQIEWVQNEGFPGGGRHVGADAVLDDVFARFRVEWAEWKAFVTEWLDAGPTVIAIGEYRGTHKATSKSAVAAFAHVYDLREGQIVRFRQYTDTAKVAEAMKP